VLRRLGRRIERLSREAAEAERALAELLAEVAPDLLQECGLGVVPRQVVDGLLRW
jgi:hypothetical protein